MKYNFTHFFKKNILFIFLFFITSISGQNAESALEKKINSFNNKSSSFLNKNIDSTVIYANKAIALAEKNKLFLPLANAYQTLGKAMYFKSNYDKALYYFNLQKKAALDCKNKGLYVFSINNIANVNIDLGKTDEAENIYKEVLEISKKEKNLEGISTGYNNLAYIARMKGNNSKAIEYIFEKIKIDDQLNQPEFIGNSYQQLAVIYLRNSNWNEAKKSIDISNQYYKKNNNERSIAINLQLESVIYENKKEYTSAIEELKKALKIIEKLSDKRTQAILYNELGRNYTFANSPHLAEEMFQKSISIYKEINLQKSLPSLLISMGKVKLSQNKMIESKEDFLEALQLSKKLKDATEIKKVYDALTDWYIKNNDAENALVYKKAFLTMNDSLLNEKNNKLLSELNVKYETEKKESKIKILNAENKFNKVELTRNKLQLENRLLEINAKNLKIINQNLQLDKKNLEIDKKNLAIANNQTKIKRQEEAITLKEQKIKLLNVENQLKKLEIQKKNTSLMVLFGSLLVLTILSYLFYNRYKIKQEIKLQKEIFHQQDIATKAVIDAEDNERKRMATHLHDGIGQLLSAANMNVSALESFVNEPEHFETVIQKTRNILSEAIEDVRTLSHQIMPNNLIKNSLANALRDLIENTTSPHLKINLKINNLQDDLDQNTQIVMYRIIQECMNNTIKHSYANTVNIQVSQSQNKLLAYFRDNGIGFNQSQIKAKSSGIGLDNIRKRIEFLKGRVDIKSNEGTGTEISVFIPINNAS